MKFKIQGGVVRSVQGVAAVLAGLAVAGPVRAQATTPESTATDAPPPPAVLPAPGSAESTSTAPAPADTSATPAPPPTPPPSPAAQKPTTNVPDASTGFQMGLGVGLGFPIGNATGATGDSLGARYAWQLPLVLELGVKILPSVFVGAYFGYAFGAEGSDPLVEALCDDNDEDLENDISCSARSYRVGLEVQYHFRPSEKVNPWIGYGAGLEGASESIEDRQQGYNETTSVSGFTAARVVFGLDFRSKIVGAGPYLGVEIGRFTKSTTEVGSVESSGDIEDPAWHAWLSLGFRLVVFP